MQEPLVSLLYRALTTPLGIAVESSDPDRLRQKLYPLRKEDPSFACLSFVLSPMNPSELWILKRPTDEEL